jgi:hypothetical protein
VLLLDFRRRQLACKHCIAYRLDSIARPIQPQPASDTVDGLRQVLEDRLTRERAAKYDHIFARFDDDGFKPLVRRGVIPATEIAREDW